MSDEAPPPDEKDDNNVISLSGEPYEAPEEGLKTACKDTIDCAEEILSYAKANQIRGIYAVGWSPAHQRFVRWCMLPSEENAHGAAVRFLGAIEIAKTDLISLTLDQIIVLDDDGNPVA